MTFSVPSRCAELRQPDVHHDGVDRMPELPGVRSQRRDRGRFPECSLPQLGHAKWVNIRRARYKDLGTVPIRHILRGVNGSAGT